MRRQQGEKEVSEKEAKWYGNIEEWRRIILWEKNRVIVTNGPSNIPNPCSLYGGFSRTMSCGMLQREFLPKVPGCGGWKRWSTEFTDAGSPVDIRDLREVKKGQHPTEFKGFGLCTIYSPFWDNLPHRHIPCFYTWSRTPAPQGHLQRSLGQVVSWNHWWSWDGCTPQGNTGLSRSLALQKGISAVK
jgi:hypothetical protein